MQEAYVTFASAVAVMFGADPTQAENEMRQVLEFETELANVGLQRINVQFHSHLENTVKILKFGTPQTITIIVL